MPIKNMPLSCKHDKAVSLVELIVAMILLTVIALTATSFAPLVKSFSVKTANYSQATESVAQALEEFSTLDYDNAAFGGSAGIPPPLGTTGIALPATPPTVFPNTFPATLGSITYAVSDEKYWKPGPPPDPASAYKIITVTATWNDGEAKSLTLTSIIPRRG